MIRLRSDPEAADAEMNHVQFFIQDDFDRPGVCVEGVHT